MEATNSPTMLKVANTVNINAIVKGIHKFQRIYSLHMHQTQTQTQAVWVFRLDSVENVSLVVIVTMHIMKD